MHRAALCTRCAQAELAIAEAGLRAARSGHASAATQAVDVVFHLAGAGAVYDGEPLQRCLRDLNIANQHIIFSTLRDQERARVHFGLAEATFFV